MMCGARIRYHIIHRHNMITYTISHNPCLSFA
jgi:hypothetical protein